MDRGFWTNANAKEKRRVFILCAALGALVAFGVVRGSIEHERERQAQYQRHYDDCRSRGSDHAFCTKAVTRAMRPRQKVKTEKQHIDEGAARIQAYCDSTGDC